MTALSKRLILFSIVITFIFLYALSNDTKYNMADNLFNLGKIAEQEVVIGPHFFIDSEENQRVLKSIKVKIRDKVVHERLTGNKAVLTLGINSGGGYVKFFEDMQYMNEIFDLLEVKCVINKAQSMAFTFILKYCDQRIMLPYASIMQHQVYHKNIFGFGTKKFSDSTLTSSIRYSILEARVLKIDKNKWWKLVRNKPNEDKFFTVEELKEYGIATGFIKEKTLGELNNTVDLFYEGGVR